MFFSPKRVSDLPVVSREEARRRTRILVIDDDPNSFPLALLKNEGYAIDHWEKVRDLGKLEAGDYDIIVLDIQGVAAEWSANDGLGILEHLKASNPAQIVVAFSGLSFDLSKNKFWRLADDSIAKPVDAATAKRVLDDLIEKKRTPAYYWSVACSALHAQGVPEEQMARLERQVVKALLKKDETGLQKVIATATGESAQSALKIIGMIKGIHSLLSS
jgi:CheY-like chemotaxis protein